MPWKTILKILRVHLEGRQVLYEHYAEKAVDDLRESYESYRDLRKFLGYTVPTKQEKEVEKILEK